MDKTTIIAIYGAAVATVVLIWDCFKWWKERFSLDVHASPDMVIAGHDSIGEQAHILVIVTNNSQPITITHLLIYHYRTRFHKLLRSRPIMQGVVTPAFGSTVPHLLETGAQWRGGIIQTPELEEKSRNGCLYVGIWAGSRKRPNIRRVIITEKPSNEPD